MSFQGILKSGRVFTITIATGPNTIYGTHPTSGEPVILQTPPILTTTDIVTVASSLTEIEMADGKPSGHTTPILTVKLTTAGSATMTKATATPTGKPIAVVVNRQVACTPKVFFPIRGSFQIQGDPNSLQFTSAVEALTKP